MPSQSNPPLPESELYAALRQSLQLQSHYAALLNAFDGGERIQFDTVEAWLERLDLYQVDRPPAATAVPERAVTLRLNIGADDRRAMVHSLRGVALHIECEELTQGVMGGYDSGYTYIYREAPGPSHDEFIEQLNRWVSSRQSI